MRKFGKILWNIIKIIPIVILVFLIVSNLYLGITKAVTKDPMPSIFGITPMFVVSGSMEPAIMTGDLIFVKKVPQSEYKPMDICTYLHKNVPFTHRIIEMQGNSITFKGDNNNVADEPVDISTVQGKVVYIIPKLGKLVMAIKTPTGIGILVVITVILLYGGTIMRRILRRK